jgi:hypothetical protein
MSATRILVVEGTSDLACLRVLDQGIGRLWARRNAYSQAHEFAHQAIAPNPENPRGAVVVFDSLLMLESRDHDQLADGPTRFPTSVDQPSPTPVHPFGSTPSTSRLPTWNTAAFAGMIPQAWPELGEGALATAMPTLSVRKADLAPIASPRVIYRLSVGAGSLIIDSWAAMVRVIDSVLVAMRLMRVLLRACLGHRLALAFFLVVLAACRHYGHRSEPDDHFSLLFRRNLVSMGSCLQA